MFSADSDPVGISYPVCLFWFLPFMVLIFLNYIFPPMSDFYFFASSFPCINEHIDSAVIIVYESFLICDSYYCHSSECWKPTASSGWEGKSRLALLRSAEEGYLDNVRGPAPHTKSSKSLSYRPLCRIPTVYKKWSCRLYPLGKYSRQQDWEQGITATTL